MENLEDFCKGCISKSNEPALYAKGIRRDGKIICSYECGRGVSSQVLCCRECRQLYCKFRQTSYGLEVEYKDKFVKALQQRLMMEKLDA